MGAASAATAADKQRRLVIILKTPVLFDRLVTAEGLRVLGSHSPPVHSSVLQ
jgi:hypothetical protein